MAESNIKQVAPISPERSRLTSIWQLPPTWLRVLIIVVLALGIFFRFANLDKKVYWVDESYTSLRIAGYLESELIQQVSERQIIGIKDLQNYQGINSEKGLIDTVSSIAIEHPEHPPLYYALARFWVQLFGNSIAVTRSSAAVISLLAFPCIYWLCMELFSWPLSFAARRANSVVPGSLVGCSAIALIAISPFHVLYAQEAREYSLWAVTILLSSACLLRAIRKSTSISWVVYAVTVAFGLYSHLYFAFLALGHGIYVLATEGLRGTKTFKTYLLASVAGIVAFSPWIIILIANLTQIRKSVGWEIQSTIPRLLLLKTLVINLNRVFIDFNLDGDRYLSHIVPLILISGTILALVGYSFYFLYTQKPQKAWKFIFALIAPTALLLIIPDLIFGWVRSTQSRYMIALYLGIHLAVAYLIAAQINSISLKIKQQKAWRIAMIALFSLGILSCAISSQADSWWNKYSSSQNLQLARIINQAPHPILLSDTNSETVNYMTIGNLLSLSYLLDSKVQLQLVVKPSIPKITDSTRDVFLLLPSQELRRQLEKEQNFHLEPVYQEKALTWLWKLVKTQ